MMKQNIRADVIILGGSLPGIVAAHKLKKKFGDSLEIVILDLDKDDEITKKPNVAFMIDKDKNTEEDVEPHHTDEMAKHYLYHYVQDLHIVIPREIASPTHDPNFTKLFQYENGDAVSCQNNFHQFEYLSFLEKFELTTYLTFLEHTMNVLFKSKVVNDTFFDSNELLSYDDNTMEDHICTALVFDTPREIMRTTVRLVCGAPAKEVSVLFYLHQCFRSNSSITQVNGDNIRFREKLLGYFKKRLFGNLRRNIDDITLAVHPIKEIKTISEKVILETMLGETNYMCNLLAMALRPEQLRGIEVNADLMPESEAMMAKEMTPGFAKKFTIKYEVNFWRKNGYSGDILSIKGPIIWAMERYVKDSCSRERGNSTSLIGYLKVNRTSDEHDEQSHMHAVISQLVELFGEGAKTPLKYKEISITDVYLPKCGHYVALNRMMNRLPMYIEWSAFDIFAEGDIGAALEAGHRTYIRVLSVLRPQCLTYEDISPLHIPAGRGLYIYSSPSRWISTINLPVLMKSTIKIIFYSTIAIVALNRLRHYLRR